MNDNSHTKPARIYNELAITNAVEDGDFLRIEGYAAHFQKANLNQERVKKSSFDEFFELYNAGKLIPGLNWNHDPNLYIGGIDELTAKRDGLYMKAHLNRSVAIVRDMLIPNILAKDISGLSTEGFVDWNDIEYLDDGTYMCNKFILTNVAVVKNPADPDAAFTFANILQNAPKPEPETPAKPWIHLL